MLALAHAYVCSPKVVLLDEVSMGLAPKIVDEIFDYLRVLASRGASLLLVEQYVSKALELADCVYIMNKGQITFVGEPYEISDEIVANSYLGALAS
jgi:branched-chain amino acid transport system ATP-binding protein